MDAADAAAVAAQLRREPRGLRRVAHRCRCGLPDVVETSPRLPDGTPFPTLYYLTCPRVVAAVSRLEGAGRMAEMAGQLGAEPGLAERYAAAHADYLARRDVLAVLPGRGSAGGMPDRVKCLHALVAHELAVPGVNPIGRQALDELPDWGAAGPCVPVGRPASRGRPPPAPRSASGGGPGEPQPTRVAAIDCGTNSIRLLIADVAGDRLTDVVRRLEIVRLGQGVDRTGRLAPEALERTRTAMRDYAEEIRRYAVRRLRLVATSATRDAANRAEFAADVRSILGVEPEVVSGAEEATLSFTGATQVLGEGFQPPYLVLDIGGGSTEFVLGADRVEAARSVDIGCVRLTERHFSTDPPTGESVAKAVADIEAGLEQVLEQVPVDRAGTLVGLAGSVTTVAAIALQLPAYDPALLQHARIPVHDVRGVADRLLAMTNEERAALPVMHPGRADVIAAGALILRTVMDRLGFGEVVVSETDILDGIAWSLA